MSQWEPSSALLRPLTPCLPPQSLIMYITSSSCHHTSRNTVSDNQLFKLYFQASIHTNSAIAIAPIIIMLPQVLAGSYQRYKEDTTSFTTWLSKAAIVCGYPTPKVLSQYMTDPKKQENQGSAIELKGRARKEAREAAKASKEAASDSRNIEPPLSVNKYEITTSELLK